jgi:hypothetical protein
LTRSTGAIHNKLGDRKPPDRQQKTAAERRKWYLSEDVCDSINRMNTDSVDLPNDIETLQAALLAERARADAARTEAAVARAEQSDAQALIVHLKLQIEKLRRETFGTRSERGVRLLDQMELQLEELEAAATEDELEAEKAAVRTTNVAAFSRKRPARRPFPEHLPRERLVMPGPATCPCRGGARLSKLGEDVTETLEVIPRRWKVIQHVREKFSDVIRPSICRNASLNAARTISVVRMAASV